MVTLYFNGAVNGDWNELGNWWLDDTFTTPAAALPTSEDNVIINYNSEVSNSGPVTVGSLIGYGAGFLSFALTATSGATFYNTFSCTYVTGNCWFTNDSYLTSGGTITGNCTFTGTGSYNGGTVYGNCTFDGAYSNNAGLVEGDCVFDASSYNWGDITGDCTFNGTSYTSGNITGDCTFTDYSYIDGGTITGDVTFRDYAEIRWMVNVLGVCRFYDNSRVFIGTSAAMTASTIEFYDNSGLAYGSANGNCVFYDSSYTNFITLVTGDATFNDTSRCSGNDVNGNLTLNDAAYGDSESAIVTGNCAVTGTGYYIGSVGGNLTLSVAAAEYRIKNPAVTATITVGGVVTVTYEKGINGSSILGIV